MPLAELCKARHMGTVFRTLLWSAIVVGSIPHTAAAQLAVQGDTNAPLHRVLVVPREGAAVHTLALRAQRAGASVLAEQDHAGVAVVSA